MDLEPEAEVEKRNLRKISAKISAFHAPNRKLRRAIIISASNSFDLLHDKSGWFRSKTKFNISNYSFEYQWRREEFAGETDTPSIKSLSHAAWMGSEQRQPPDGNEV